MARALKPGRSLFSETIDRLAGGAGCEIFYAKSDIRMVDERAMLETLAGTPDFYIMIKMPFLRSVLAVAALAAGPFLANTASAAVGDILETNEGNVLRFRTPGATPATVATGLANPKGIVFDGLGR